MHAAGPVATVAGTVGGAAMPVEKWSEDVLIAHLADEPNLGEDLMSVEGERPRKHVVLDFAAVRFITSSSIGKLLQLRKQQAAADAKLILCNVGEPIRGALRVTAIEKLFEFGGDVFLALATLQLDAAAEEG